MRENRIYHCLYVRLRDVRDRHPGVVRRLFGLANRLLRVRPPVRFSGWGLTTEHHLPWTADDGAARRFLAAEQEVSRFTFTGEAGVSRDNLVGLRWRHWVVCQSVRQALASADVDDFELVECGVADGTTAAFALHEARAVLGDGRALRMHLYDSWGEMDPTLLAESERAQIGRYAALSVDVAKSNLKQFGDHLVFHVGYAPTTFDREPASPDRVAYVHIDLNAASPTLAACEYFWSRLVRGGVVLFDDYGWLGFEDTRAAIDGFFRDKPGALHVLPTAQALFIRA